MPWTHRAGRKRSPDTSRAAPTRRRRSGSRKDSSSRQSAAGTATISVTQAGRDDPLFLGVPDVLEAFVGHKEAVTRLPEGAVVLATGELCPVQAFKVGRRVYATQFHPELDPAGMAERLQIYRNHGYFDPDKTEELVAEALAAPVGAEVNRLLANFVALARR